MCRCFSVFGLRPLYLLFWSNGTGHLKKGQCLLCERNEVKFDFIKNELHDFPVITLCRVMQVSTSAYYDWIFKVHQPTREHMRQDVAVYMKYYHLEKLHSSNGNMTPAEYENSLEKVSGKS